MLKNALFILLIAAFGELFSASVDTSLGGRRRSLSVGSSTSRSTRHLMEEGRGLAAPLLQETVALPLAAGARLGRHNRVAPLEVGEPVAAPRRGFLGRCWDWCGPKIENPSHQKVIAVTAAAAFGFLLGASFIVLTDPSCPKDHRIENLNQCPDLEQQCRAQIFYCFTGRWPNWR